MITKNYLDDICERCVGNTNCFMFDFLTCEENLIDDNEVMIEEDGFFEDDMQGQFQILQGNPPCIFYLCFYENPKVVMKLL